MQFGTVKAPWKARSEKTADEGLEYAVQTACNAGSRDDSGFWPGVDVDVLDRQPVGGKPGHAWSGGSIPCDGVVRAVPVGAF